MPTCKVWHPGTWVHFPWFPWKIENLGTPQLFFKLLENLVSDGIRMYCRCTSRRHTGGVHGLSQPVVAQAVGHNTLVRYTFYHTSTCTWKWTAQAPRMPCSHCMQYGIPHIYFSTRFAYKHRIDHANTQSASNERLPGHFPSFPCYQDKTPNLETVPGELGRLAYIHALPTPPCRISTITVIHKHSPNIMQFINVWTLNPTSIWAS